jgi:hypothetical protein
VAVQVTVVAPSANALPDAGVQLVATAPSTRSVAEAANVTAAPAGPVASAVIGAGTLIAGGVVSVTVTVNVADALLPAASRAVHVTVVAPVANTLPEAGEHAVASLPSTLSLALALNVTVAPPGPVASVVIGAGTVIAGGVMSLTTTGKLALAVLPAVSRAVHVTSVLPSANSEPEAGVQLAATAPSTLSIAAAA